MRFSHRSLTRLATLASILLASPIAGRLAAQGPSASDSVTAAAADSVTPVTVQRSEPAKANVGAPLTGLRSGAHARETDRPFAPNAAATRANLGQDRAMMVVGAAALITGAIIGGEAGTIIMVGGAVIGLYGLYQYLQ